MRPHRQKVLTNDGEEIRLQRWANKKAAESLRTAGGDASGEQFTQARDMLMRDAVANPEEHGLKFMNERVPFEGQNLESSLSEPDYSGEAEADFALRQEELEQAMKEGTTPNESQEDIDADKKRMPNLFDSEGKLRDGMPPEEEEFNPDAEAEHMRRIMTSRDVAMRDAWSVLKQEQYNPAPTPKQEYLQSLRFPTDVGRSNCGRCNGKGCNHCLPAVAENDMRMNQYNP